MTDSSAAQDATWIFGYGSLIWRTEFPYAESRPAFIRGWSRRFWQGSTDHRGVPEAPGRVVTLIEEQDSICWGRAYRMAQGQETAVLEQLDYREKGGYERHQLSLHFSESESVSGTLYHATEDNENFLGEAPIEIIARQVMSACGPSGPNPEYVFRLEQALQDLGAADPHVTELADSLRQLMGTGPVLGSVAVLGSE